MMRLKLLIMYAAFFLIAFGASAQAGDDTLIGTGLGAAVGGLFGSQIGHGPGQIVATGTGIVVGGVIGNTVGRSIEADNAGSGSGYAPGYNTAPIVYNAGPYTPNYVAPPAIPPTYVDTGAGTYCRPYSQEIRIAGRVEESYGTACLQPDGTWHIVE